MKTKVYNLNGVSDKEVTLSLDVTDAKKEALIVQAVRTQMNNRRNAIANTKTRGEVSGGGRKPWKQKGTGNARAGSTRSPLWTGGGITFGPTSARNFSLRLNKQMRRGAIKAVLSQKIQEHKLLVVTDLELKKISTKALVQVLQKLPIEEGKILVILENLNANFELSAANLPYLKTIKTTNLNVIDLMNYDYILVTLEALNKMNETWGAK